MKTNNIRSLSILGLYLALIMILTFVPYTGYIQIGPLAITIIPIIVAIATYDSGFKGALLSGIAFGFGSFLRATTMFPSLMVNPMLSIAPRIIMSFFIYGIYKLLGVLKLWKFIILVMSSAFLNSFCVSAFYFIVQLYDASYKSSFIVWILLIYINFIAEISSSIILSIPLYRILLIRENFKNNLNHY